MTHLVTIIGLGNMGGALARGILNSELSDRIQLRLFDQHRERCEEFSDLSSSVTILNSLEGTNFNAGIVVICVKPQDFPTVAAHIKDSLSRDTLIISILAGTRVHEIESELHHAGGVIRAMPNIAATVGYAATAMCCNDHCTAQQKEFAQDLFNAVGEAYWTKEALMDTVTGLSGSGPAYIYMVIEALTDGGVKMGLPRKLSLDLSTQTVLGAAMLVKKTGLHPAILKEQVTTPAGTTISALHELEERGLRSMFVSAVEKATERSIYLGEKKKKG
jgi:pyrroline-5-carboxylate reductase